MKTERATASQDAGRETIAYVADLRAAAESLREGAAILLRAADMEEHNYAIFSGRWKKGSKAWSGAFIRKLRNEGAAKVREAMQRLAAAASGESHEGPLPTPSHAMRNEQG